MPLLAFVLIILLGTLCIFTLSYFIKSIHDMGAASPEQMAELKHLSKYSETLRDVVNGYAQKGYVSRGEYKEVIDFYELYVSQD